MKDLFPEYYRVDSIPDFDRLWDNDALFAFDANVLLNIYSFSKAHRRQWLDTMHSLGQRAYLPFQAAYEYHRNLKSKIQEIRKSTEEDTLAIFTKCKNQIAPELPRTNPIRTELPIVNARKELLDRLDLAHSAARNCVDSWKSNYETEWREVREELATIFAQSRLGKTPTTSKVKSWIDEGVARYAQNRPPGYKDAQKNIGNPYGDLFIWFDIIAEAQRRNAPMIFVSFEEKPDWCVKEHGSVSARPELTNEFLTKTGHEFEFASAERFLSWMELRRGSVAGAKEELKEITARDRADQKRPTIVNCPACRKQTLVILDGALRCNNCRYVSNDPTESFEYNLQNIPRGLANGVYLRAQPIDGCCTDRVLDISALDRKGIPEDNCRICFSCGKIDECECDEP